MADSFKYSPCESTQPYSPRSPLSLRDMNPNVIMNTSPFSQSWSRAHIGLPQQGSEPYGFQAGLPWAESTDDLIFQQRHINPSAEQGPVHDLGAMLTASLVRHKRMLTIMFPTFSASNFADLAVFYESVPNPNGAIVQHWAQHLRQDARDVWRWVEIVDALCTSAGVIPRSVARGPKLEEEEGQHVAGQRKILPPPPPPLVLGSGAVRSQSLEYGLPTPSSETCSPALPSSTSLPSTSGSLIWNSTLSTTSPSLSPIRMKLEDVPTSHHPSSSPLSSPEPSSPLSEFPPPPPFYPAEPIPIMHPLPSKPEIRLCEENPTPAPTCVSAGPRKKLGINTNIPMVGLPRSSPAPMQSQSMPKGSQARMRYHPYIHPQQSYMRSLPHRQPIPAGFSARNPRLPASDAHLSPPNSPYPHPTQFLYSQHPAVSPVLVYQTHINPPQLRHEALSTAHLPQGLHYQNTRMAVPVSHPSTDMPPFTPPDVLIPANSLGYPCSTPSSQGSPTSDPGCDEVADEGPSLAFGEYMRVKQEPMD